MRRSSYHRLLDQAAAQLAEKHRTDVPEIHATEIFQRFRRLPDGDSLDAVECVIELTEAFDTSARRT